MSVQVNFIVAYKLSAAQQKIEERCNVRSFQMNELPSNIQLILNLVFNGYYHVIYQY